MKHILSLFFVLLSLTSYSQIVKTGGILYSNGNPNTRGLDTLTLKNLNRNSEVAVDVSTGSMSIFNRTDSAYVEIVSKDTTMGVSQTHAPNEYAVRKAITVAKPYRVYTALLTQTGTSAPTVTVLENTLGVVPTLSYLDVGYYRITISGTTFVDGKTWVITSSTDQISSANSYSARRTSATRAEIQSLESGVLTNGLLTNHPIEIRVYN